MSLTVCLFVCETSKSMYVSRGVCISAHMCMFVCGCVFVSMCVHSSSGSALLRIMLFWKSQ